MKSRGAAVSVVLVVLMAASVEPALFADDAKRDTPTVKFGAFVDTYYAYDFNQPPTGDRIRLFPSGNAYATQPTRNNEFNVNLAYVEGKLEGAKLRGRLALQAGTSVQANYAGDSAVDQSRYGGAGGISRYIQEAYAGYQIAPKFWVDAGIFFSHIGFEGWISRDDWNYTRSLAADNTPYYQTGVKFSYSFSDQVSGQLLVLNGWQNINDTNPQKALGTQLSYSPNAAWNVTYNTFFGYEPDGTGTEGSRIFQDLIVKWVASDAFQLAAQLDLGLQKPTGGDTTNPWYSGTLFARYQTSPTVAVNARLEKFTDTLNSVIGAAPTGFNISGASFGVDVALQSQLLWRNEVRGFRGESAAFPAKSGPSNTDGFVVSSLALTLQ